MFLNKILSGLGLVLVGLASACGAADDMDTSEASVETDYQAVEGEKVLARFDAGYGDILFVEATSPSGAKLVGILEQMPVNYRTSPLQIAAAPGHTSLELFVAIMPEREVPESLVLAHDVEARQLGRTSNEIVPASYDPNVPIEKYSISSCIQDVLPSNTTGCYPYTHINGRYTQNRSGGSAGSPIGLAVQTDAGVYATYNPVTLGICNDSNVTVQSRLSVKYTGPGSSGNWSPFGWVPVPPQSKIWWPKRTYLNTGTCSDPWGCIPPEYPSYYRVQAYSPAGKNFHLVTGEYKSLGLPCVK